jgi:hypothetical protein
MRFPKFEKSNFRSKKIAADFLGGDVEHFRGTDAKDVFRLEAHLVVEPIRDLRRAHEHGLGELRAVPVLDNDAAQKLTIIEYNAHFSLLLSAYVLKFEKSNSVVHYTHAIGKVNTKI